MKLHEDDREVVTSGGLEEQEFKMDDASLHVIFDVLRSKVYSNPIGSLCREVVSNSRDAQREAGVTDPVEVEIRGDNKDVDIWDADTGGISIVFRDRGTGISPARMRDVYSKYGASTKRDSNSLTGGFGLGAKTPFAYADAFTVTTVFDGVRYNYSVYIDQSRKGLIALTDEERVEAPNGTEIIVPLQRKDVQTFEYEVVKSTHFWEVRPKLIGFRYHGFFNLASPKLQTKLEEPGVYLLVAPGTGFVESSVNVVIDGIYYPVDVHITKDPVHGASIIMPFGNGELTVGANREQLQYDDRTKDLIGQRLAEARAIIAKGYDDLFAKEKTLLGAIELDASLRQRDVFYNSTISSSPRTHEVAGVSYTLDRAPWSLRTHEILHITCNNTRGTRSVLTRIDSYQVHNTPVYFRACGDKARPGTWRTLLDRHKSFVVLTQRDPHMVGTSLANPEGYYEDVSHDVSTIETLGIVLRDFAEVDVERAERTPTEKSKLVLRTASRSNIYRATYRVEDGEVFLDDGKPTPVQLVVHWLENETHGVPADVAQLLQDASEIADITNKLRDSATTKMVRVVAASKSKSRKLGRVVELDDFLERSPLVSDLVHYMENHRTVEDATVLRVQYPTKEQRDAHAQIVAFDARVKRAGLHALSVPSLTRHVATKKFVKPWGIVDPIGDRSDLPLLNSLHGVTDKNTYMKQVLETRALRAEVEALKQQIQQLHAQEEPAVAA